MAQVLLVQHRLFVNHGPSIGLDDRLGSSFLFLTLAWALFESTDQVFSQA